MPDLLKKMTWLPDKKLPIRVINRDPQSEFAPHCHEFSELVIVYRGRGRHEVYDQVRTVGPGDVFLIHGNTRHSYSEVDDLALYNILFDLRGTSNPVPMLSKYSGIRRLFALESGIHRARLLHLDPDSLETALSFVRRMEDDQKLGLEDSPATISAWFTLLAAHLGRFTEQWSDSGQASEKLKNLMNQLYEYPEKKWTRKQMAKFVGMSESSLTRCFKEAVGEAPNEFFLSSRLKQAAVLLENSELSVGEIAERTGFPDSNYFCRQFRRHFAVSPLKYRKR